MFTCNSTKLTSAPIIAYNSNVHFARNDPFSHLRSHRIQFYIKTLLLMTSEMACEESQKCMIYASMSNVVSNVLWSI